MTVEGAIDSGLAFLTDARNADGSWGYQKGSDGHLEPTVLCAAAGLPIAAPWIRAQPKSWPNLLLPAAVFDQDPVLAAESADWIVTQQSISLDLSKDFDGTIPAWSWVEGTSAWIEPTTYAILSLVRTGKGAARIVDGRRLIRNRQCPDGGWNYGNPRMMGTELEGQAPPTGWALLALDRNEPAVEGGLAAIAKSALAEPSTLGLSLATLASVWHRRDPTRFVDALAPRIGSQGARGRVDWTAIAVTALQSVVSNRVVFELPDPP